MDSEKQSEQSKVTGEMPAQTREALEKFASELQQVAKTINDGLQRVEPTLSKLFDSMTSYVRTVMTIGYASFFGIWAFSREHMTAGQTLFTALLMLISVLCIVSNEVVNVIAWNRLTSDLGKRINEGTRSEKLTHMSSAVAAIQAQLKRYSLIRPWVFRLALLTAGLAVCIMLFALLSGLWSEYQNQ